MAKKIVFFNHKGGVSKTTTTYHISWMLANMGHKTLLVDADPQCNLTALILSADQFEKYYVDETTKNHNIKDGVKVAFEGKPEPIKAVNCVQASGNNNLFLLPGHANLSEYDASLSFAQTASATLYTLQNLPGAFNQLINLCAAKYDIEYVLIDLNPGLSAINQNFFTLSDYFIVPTNPDPFSIMAINTLATVLPRWVDWIERMRPEFESASYPLPQTTPKLIGTLIQRFNIRKGVAAKPYRDNIQEIKDITRNRLIPVLRRKNMLVQEEAYEIEDLVENDFCLAEISDFQGLLPKANLNNVPVFSLSDEQLEVKGVLLDNMRESRETFKSLYESITNKIIAITNYAESLQPV